MIKKITIKNFKPFENQAFDLSNLTVLSGLNSTGKSSFLQVLLLLRQSYQQDLLPGQGLALNGELVSIGTGKDALCESAKEDVIGFDIVWENEKQGSWLFDYNRDTDVIKLSSPEDNPDIYKYSLFNDQFHYIQPERLGPRVYYEMSDFKVRQHQQLGTKGEFTAHFLFINEEKKVIFSDKISHPDANSEELKDQVQAWLGEVSPGIRINTDYNSEMDVVKLQYFQGDENPHRPTNVGFGVSYTLHIIVAILSAKPGTLILLENPEAHLHPKGQSKIGELMALAASCGVQIIVETHSDHILNGIRLAAYNKKINAEDVQLHYFSRELMREQVLTKVVSPRLDQDGGIDLWPDGFFDQAEKDLMEML